jgi:hypothetical protein
MKILSFNIHKHKFLAILFSITFLIRVPIIYLYGDINLENEWLILFNNLTKYQTLALITFDDFLVPNLWMPPLYAYYLYFLSFLNLEGKSFINLVLFSQALLSSCSVILFYKIIRKFFSTKMSIFGSTILCFFPLYIYAAAQISSLVITIFLSLLFYFSFLKITEKSKLKYIFLFSIVAGLLILTRREFILILFLTIIYLFFFYKINFKKILIIGVISTLTISPYLIRNYLIFDKIILQAGFGYNIWKGNNPESMVEGSLTLLPSPDLRKKLNTVKKDVYYRINEDKIYLKQAIIYIEGDPKRYLKLYFVKMFSYFFIDLNSSKENYYNPFHYIPVLMLSIFSLLGIYYSNKKSLFLNYFLLIMLIYIFLIPIFAVLPRYKLYLVLFQIIFSLVFFKKILRGRFD